MERADLDAIQSKLKLAIRNHQMLVVKMKAEPQNAAMKTKLHELQTEIMSLSEKQKTIVQNLRKELVQKQIIPIQPAVATLSQPITLAPSPVSVQAMAPSQVLAPVSAPGMTLCQPQLVACSTSMQAQAVIIPTTFSVTVPAAHSKLQTCQAVVVPVSAAVCQPSDLTVCLDPTKQQTVNNIITTQSSQVPIKPALKTLAPRGTSPPIKVPQYPIISSTSKGSVTHGQKSVLVNSRNHMPPPNSTPQRRVSDSDITKDSRRTADRKQIKPEVKQKLDFMATLDLVTPEALKELQSKRTERKRRSTANPQFSYNFEPERKRVSHYLLNPLPPGVKRPRGRPPKHGPSPNNSRPTTPDSPSNGSLYKNNIMRNGSGEPEMHDDFCAVCGKEGDLLLCSSCNMVYHMDCLNPPLTAVPTGPWSCPKCQASNKNWAGSAETLALVHSYIATKAAKEEERRKLQKKTNDLSTEKIQLEARSKQLNNSFNEQVERNQHLLSTTSDTQLTIEKLKNIIKVVQST